MEKKRDLLQDTFYSKIFKLVLPIIIQNLLSAAVSSADVVMLNYVGQSSISAVSLASQYVSILFMVFYGLGTGATILCAQYYGKGDLQAIQVSDTIDMWCYAVPLGFLAAFALKLPVMWVYFLLCTDEFVKWPWVIRHYRSGKWLNNITWDHLFEENQERI